MANEYQPVERELTQWNLSEWKTNTIGMLIQKSTAEALKNNFSGFFNCWKQIAIIIDNRITKEEQDKLLKLEIQIYEKGMLAISKEENSYLTKNERIIPNGIVYKFLVEKYAKYVNHLLKEIGMDMKTKDFSDEEMD